MTHFIMEIYTVLNVGLVILQNLQVLTKLIDYIVSYKHLNKIRGLIVINNFLVVYRLFILLELRIHSGCGVWTGYALFIKTIPSHYTIHNKFDKFVVLQLV